MKKKARGEKVDFYGTFSEFIDLIHEKGFWSSEEAYQVYTTDEKYTLFNCYYGLYSADFRDKSLQFLPASKGYLVTEKKKQPMNTRTNFSIDSTGFTQEELNRAFALTFEALRKQTTDGKKEFLVTKHTTA